MSSIRNTAAALLAALALGGAVLSSAQAAPHGGRGGGHHMGHGGHGGGHHFRHRGHWRGIGIAPIAYYGGRRCRLVERVNRYGDVVLRRVCRYPAYY